MYDYYFYNRKLRNESSQYGGSIVVSYQSTLLEEQP